MLLNKIHSKIKIEFQHKDNHKIACYLLFFSLTETHIYPYKFHSNKGSHLYCRDTNRIVFLVSLLYWEPRGIHKLAGKYYPRKQIYQLDKDNNRTFSEDFLQASLIKEKCTYQYKSHSNRGNWFQYKDNHRTILRSDNASPKVQDILVNKYRSNTKICFQKYRDTNKNFFESDFLELPARVENCKNLDKFDPSGAIAKAYKHTNRNPFEDMFLVSQESKAKDKYFCKFD